MYIKKICETINQAKIPSIIHGECHDDSNTWECMIHFVYKDRGDYCFSVEKTCVNGTLISINSNESWGFNFGTYRCDRLSDILMEVGNSRDDTEL
jgi:hypothetical protein